MIRNALAGFAAGAVVAALSAALFLRRPVPAAADRPGAPAADGTSVTAPGTSAGSLNEEIALLEERVRAQKAELDLKSANPQGAGPSRARALRAALAKRLAARARAIVDGNVIQSEEGMTLEIEFQRWLAALVEETGLTLAEATWSPDGLFAFVNDVAASLDPPLPAQVLQELRAGREQALKDWEAYLRDRPGLSLLRRGLETSGRVDRLYDVLCDSLPDDTYDEITETFENFELSWSDVNSSSFWGTRAEIRVELMRDWSSQLKLRREQETAMGPIIEEYMVRFAAIRSQAPTVSGQSYVAGIETRRAEIALQEEMQKRIAAELDLDAPQAERLRLWATTYQLEENR